MAFRVLMRHIFTPFLKKIAGPPRCILAIAAATPVIIAATKADTEVHQSLTRQECMKQACLLVLNATTTLLTTTVSAIVDVSDKYKEALSNASSVLETCIAQDGWNDELSDSMISLRSDINSFKEELNKLEIFVESLDKLVMATIETTFNLDASYMCKIMGERSQSAEEEIRRIKREIKDLEDRYLLLQSQVIKFKRNEEGGNTTTSD